MKSLHERIPQLYHLLMGEMVSREAAKKASDVLESNQELFAFLVLKADCFQNEPSIMGFLAQTAEVEVPKFTSTFESRFSEVMPSESLEKALSLLLTTYESKTKSARDAERLLRQHAVMHLDLGSSQISERWALP